MEILKEFKKYLEELYNNDGEQNTIKAYYADIEQFMSFFKEYYGEDIVDFQRVHITEYKQNFLDKKEYKFTTINRKIASISIYENFLIEKGIRIDNKKVINKHDFYKIERPYISYDMLPNKEIKKLKLKAGTSSKRDYAMFVLLDDGALRVSEMINLQLKRDIDFDMYSIKVLGKGRRVREIFMEEAIIAALRDYIPEREKLLNGRENKYLFISNKTANTNRPICRTTVNQIIKKYENSDGLHPHILRHHGATEKYMRGLSDIMLKKFLGQTSNITDAYTHPGGEEYRKKPIK